LELRIRNCKIILKQNREMNKLKNNYKPVLLLMVVHALLVIIWNIVGVWLISEGKSAPGPTATMMAALVFAIFILGYLFFYNKGFKKLFILIVTIGALFAFSAIYGAFTKDPALWPSEFWRYTGIVVNSIGVLGFLILLNKSIKK